jgi:hypothetical protein
MKNTLHLFFCLCLIVFVCLLCSAQRPTLSVDRTQSDTLRTFAFSHDGKLFGTVTSDMTIKVWNVTTGKLIAAFPGKAKVLSIAFGADRVASGAEDGSLRIWDLNSKKMSQLSNAHGGPVTSLAFTPEGQRLFSASLDDRLKAWDFALRPLELGGEIIAGKEGINAMALSPDGSIIAGGGMNGNVKLWRSSDGRELGILQGNSTPITAVAFDSEGKLVVAGSANGTIRLWRPDPAVRFATQPLLEHKIEVGPKSLAFSPNGQTIFSAISGTTEAQELNISQTTIPAVLTPEVKLQTQALGTVYSFRDGTWAVLDVSGRYDASNGGDLPWINWVVADQPVMLSQLKERYYEPGLLAKHMGFVSEPLRSVSELKDVKLFPAVKPELVSNTDKLNVRLTNRGGGIGKVQVFVNGKEILADARTPGINPQASSAEFSFNLLDWKQFFAPGAANTVEVRVYNAEGYLSSRDVKIAYNPPPEAAPAKPELWAIVAGVSNYSDQQLNLRYAAKDAEDFASALQIGANSLFSPQRVHITVLSTSGKAGTILPTRENLVKALTAASKAKSTDILLAYLSGHGVTHGGQDGDYYYLTKEATTGSLDDPDLRHQRTLSSGEIADLIRKVPANKQVLILDTCAAGRLAEKLSEGREMSSSAERAFDRMKDRTGTFVLAGSAADRVSYEASRYGQGLLTYSLLDGMRGRALAADSTVDVNTLFQYARDEVPNLARGIGGIQSPVLVFPTGGASFAIGIVAPDDRERIPFHPVRPVILRSSFQEEAQLRDVLNLGRRVDDALRDISSRGADSTLVFWDSIDGPDAFSLAGRYTVTGNTLAARVVVFKENVRLGEFVVSGKTEDVGTVVTNIVKEVNKQTTH